MIPSKLYLSSQVDFCNHVRVGILLFSTTFPFVQYYLYCLNTGSSHYCKYGTIQTSPGCSHKIAFRCFYHVKEKIASYMLTVVFSVPPGLLHFRYSLYIVTSCIPLSFKYGQLLSFLLHFRLQRRQLILQVFCFGFQGLVKDGRTDKKNCWCFIQYRMC